MNDSRQQLLFSNNSVMLEYTSLRWGARGQNKGGDRVQFYTASTRKANRLSIALMNLTGHPPSMFRFPGGGWAVQEESLSAAAGQAICRLLAGGVRCDR